jgi:hypothetical protein
MGSVVAFFGIEHHRASEEYIWDIADMKDVLVSDWLSNILVAIVVLKEITLLTSTRSYSEEATADTVI